MTRLPLLQEAHRALVALEVEQHSWAKHCEREAWGDQIETFLFFEQLLRLKANLETIESECLEVEKMLIEKRAGELRRKQL